MLKSDWQHALWQDYTFELPSPAPPHRCFGQAAENEAVSVLRNSFSALSLVSSKNGAVLTVLSVREKAWSSSKLQCSLVLHILSSLSGWRLHVRSALVSALCNSFSALSLVSSQNGAVLTALSVWKEAWGSSKLRCSLVLHFLSSDSHGGEA